MNCIVKSADLVKDWPSTPATRVVLEVVTLAAVSSCRAILRIVKFPEPVGMVATCVTTCPLLVGVPSNAWSNSLVTAPPLLRAVSVAVNALEESSIDRVLMYREAE